MSAITETRPGEPMVCIVEFSARPRDGSNALVPGERRTFRVGESVRFVGSFRKEMPADNPTGLMALFEPLGVGETGRYAATVAYFVDVNCWAGIKSYFAERLRVIDYKIGFVEPVDPPSQPGVRSKPRRPRARVKATDGE